jgi:HNH endonuclease/AP2 domain
MPKLKPSDPVLVDDCDAELREYRFSVNRAGRIDYHRGTRAPMVGRYAHRLVMERMLGRPLLRSEQVDHINGNGLDNRRSNLRLATKRQNQQNRQRRINGSSIYKGVSLFKRDGTWKSQINIDGLQKHIGYFKTQEAAARAYDAAALKHFGEFARINFPDDQCAA